ncbi:MAG: hypothetical protein FWG67_08565 [Defluviitaleaceae bacterium]|nr:hypothetical protein [Defluviitaleaceae bacterium]
MKVKNKKVKKGIVVALLGIALAGAAVPVAASWDTRAGWHSSEITVPRNGWWTTTDRRATSNTQQARVNRPTYNVVSNIQNTNGRNLSSNQTHNSNQDITQSHNTSASGSMIRGAFRSSIINQRTNTINLSWRP